MNKPTTAARDRAQLRLIWGLVAAVAVIQFLAWTMSPKIEGQAGVLVQLGAGWLVMLALALLASRRIGTLAERLTAKEDAHQATLDEVTQLQTQNAMLQIVARSVDVPLTFQALALRIARLVPCERVGLALLTETGQEFETFTARVRDDERRNRPRPDVVFKTDSTAIGQVVRTAEPLLFDNIEESAPDFLDVNVLHTAGFKSALLMPLVSNGRAVGTLNVVARQASAFHVSNVETLRPIAEILAVAHVAQQLHMTLGKYRTIETMAEVMLSISAEINSALQTIIGHCDLLERGYPDPGLQRDLATVIVQAQRIAGLLEKMRSSANERLKEVTHSLEETGIPTSPEVYEQKEAM